jgi:glycine betaine catabolism A
MTTQAQAPIDRAAVGRTLAPFGESLTLPAEAFHSDELLAWELEHFFAGSWVCVGRSVDVGPGEWKAVRVGTESVVLARDDRAGLAAFSNVCRHRGHELVEDGQPVRSARGIQCPYHGWTYGLDGRLRAAPSFGGRAGFDREELGLIGAAVEEWFGWIFVNATAGAPSLREQVGTLDGVLDPYRLDRLVSGAEVAYDVEANWKLIVENYHECYHCTAIHPELCRVSPHDSGVNFEPDGAWVGGRMALMDDAETMSLSGRSDGVMLPGLTPDQQREVVYVGLFPNLLVSAHPDYVLTHRLEPLATGRTRVTCEWLFDPRAAERADFDPAYAVDFWDLTNRQDWRACEAVQRGTANRGYRPGPLSPRESAVYQFLSIVAVGYLGGRVGAPTVSPAPSATRSPSPARP